MKKEELNEEKKNLIKKLSGLVDKVSDLELCPRCLHYICLKAGKCPHCGLVKKGDEWIMTKEAIKEKEIEKEKKKEKEKVYGNLFGSVITFDEGEKSEEEKEK